MDHLHSSGSRSAEKVTPASENAAPIQTPEQRREIATRAIAKYCCIIAGIEPVDSMDGSAHWWLFVKEAEALYDDIVRRFPPLAIPDEASAVSGDRSQADANTAGEVIHK